MGDNRLLYVETVAAEALDLAEDIVYLSQAKLLLNKVTHIDKDQRNEAWVLLNAFELEARHRLRREFIETRPKAIYASLKERLLQELKKEIANGTDTPL